MEETEYKSYINELDEDIIELLSMRQNLLTNTKNFKVMELGGYHMGEQFTSKLDYNIFQYELKFHSNKKNYYGKLFNESLETNKEDYEDLNLSRIIKYSYTTFLYDLCEYGDDEKNDIACNLDIEILFKLSERIHFGYEMMKLKYINNMNFYDKLFESNDSSFILYYLSQSIYQPTYLDLLKETCIKYNVCDVFICSFFKNVIIPYYNEIQLHFCLKMKELKQISKV